MLPPENSPPHRTYGRLFVLLFVFVVFVSAGRIVSIRCGDICGIGLAICDSGIGSVRISIAVSTVITGIITAIIAAVITAAAVIVTAVASRSVAITAGAAVVSTVGAAAISAGARVLAVSYIDSVSRVSSVGFTDVSTVSSG